MYSTVTPMSNLCHQSTIDNYMKRAGSSDIDGMPSPKKALLQTMAPEAAKPAVVEPKDASKSEFDKMFENLTTHLTQLTTNMEKNLSAKITSSISTAIQQELATAMQGIREEFQAELTVLKDRMQAIEERPLVDPNVSYASKTAEGFDNVLYMSGIPISDHENISHKVNSVIKDGCKVRDAKVTKAERKKGFNGKPGVVAVSLENKEQVDLVMAGVKHLKASDNHKRIFVNRHMSKEARALKANTRTLLKACGKDNDFVYKGAYLVKKKPGA